jgi:branched-chain amino acid aminotransferase
MTLPLPPGTRLPDRTVWLNGQLVRGEAAALSLWDRGARMGGAIFETMRVYSGKPFAWERHLERLVLSAAELGFPVPPSPATLRDAVDAVLATEKLSDAVVRITVTRGVPGGRPVRTGAWVEAETLGSRLWAGSRRRDARPDGGATVIRSQWPFSPGWLGRHKTTSRLAWDLPGEEARAARADEALLCSPDGHVLEGAASNVFVVRPDGIVLTPPLDDDVLPGITRDLVMSLCLLIGIEVRETRIPLDALELAAEVFLTNSVQEVLPVAELCGRPVPSQRVGRLVLQAYRERVTPS